MSDAEEFDRVDVRGGRVRVVTTFEAWSPGWSAAEEEAYKEGPDHGRQLDL